jgi:tetratricopeptide (TPR) repeat protein
MRQMKNVLRLLTFSTLVALFALPAFAQATSTTTPAATTPAAQQPNTVCIDLYNKWRENRNGDAATQKNAYEAGKQYLSQCSTDEYVRYVQTWVGKYEKALRDIEFARTLTEKRFSEAFNLGRQILREDADNLPVLFQLSNAGLANLSAGSAAVESLNADAANYARRALQLIESGKTVDAWTPFANREDAIGWLHYTLGLLSIKNTPKDAIAHFIKAAQTNFSAKNDPAIYYYLASAYQSAEYKPQADAYQVACAGKDLTDECKAKLNDLNLVVDRIIDAYARAIAFAGNNPKKADWMNQLKGFYKFRNNDSEAGLNELIAGIQSKPLLLPSMQQTTPAPAPSTGGTTNPATTTTPAASGNAPASNAVKTTTTNKPPKR